MSRGVRRDIGLSGTSLKTLAEAREEAHRVRKAARAGRDPIAERDGEIRARVTFEDVARSVHASQIVPVKTNPKHVAQWISSLETYAFPKLDRKPISQISQRDVALALAPIWNEKPETARRVKQRIKIIFDYARGHELYDGSNPVEAIEVLLGAQRKASRHHAALKWQDLPQTYQRLSEARGNGALALRFLILTAARSGEVRGATWTEIDLERGTWTVPAQRMKAREEHIVPLATGAVEILKSIQPQHTPTNSLVFEGMKPGRPLSDMTLAKALSRECENATPHGFRSTFRDWVAEQTDYTHEVAEAAIAHKVSDAVVRAYRRTDFFDKRRALMEEWGQFACSAAKY